MKETESLFINSEITVVSQIGDADVIVASRAKPEPSNASIIKIFQENMKKKNNCERGSLGEGETSSRKESEGAHA